MFSVLVYVIISNLWYKLIVFINHLCRNWIVVERPVGAHRRHVNGILGLLVRDHFPGLVTLAGEPGPAYTWEHYRAVPDMRDVAGRQWPNLAERVKGELWVSDQYIAFVAHP
jgi:hypothetical protein